ncbi:hypothetical protein D3C72_1353630 [compost metagenome]
MARPMISTATHRFDAKAAKATGTAHRAQISMVSLRALFRLMPLFMKRPDIQPPPTEPTSDSR